MSGNPYCGKEGTATIGAHLVRSKQPCALFSVKRLNRLNYQAGDYCWVVGSERRGRAYSILYGTQVTTITVIKVVSVSC